MPYLAETDLTSLIYQEKIDEIKRDSTTHVPKAIKGAIDFAKSFLSRFDLLALFGDDSTEATVDDQNLKDHVISVACYRLARLCNPGLNLEELRMYYDDAETWLQKVQKGNADPDGWPIKPIADDGTNPGALVSWHSQLKRTDNY